MQSDMGTSKDLDYNKGLVINYREGRRLQNGRGDNLSFTHTKTGCTNFGRTRREGDWGCFNMMA